MKSLKQSANPNCSICQGSGQDTRITGFTGLCECINERPIDPELLHATLIDTPELIVSSTNEDTTSLQIITEPEIKGKEERAFTLQNMLDCYKSGAQSVSSNWDEVNEEFMRSYFKQLFKIDIDNH